MPVSISKPLIFVVISVLLIIYFSSATLSALAAGPIDCRHTGTMTITCCQDHIINRSPANPAGTLVRYCTDCEAGPGGTTDTIRNCGERYVDMSAEQPPTPSLPTPPTAGESVLPEDGVFEQPPTPLPSGPAAPLQGGVLEQLEQDPEMEFLERQPAPADQGATELPPPATEETQPATATEEEQPVPVCQEGLEFNEDLGFCVPTECPEGQELNEETGICVLEEQPAAAEEPEEQQQQTEEGQQQPEPEEDQPSEDTNSEDNGNN